MAGVAGYLYGEVEDGSGPVDPREREKSGPILRAMDGSDGFSGAGSAGGEVRPIKCEVVLVGRKVSLCVPAHRREFFGNRRGDGR